MKKAETGDSKLFELNNKKDDSKKVKDRPSVAKKETKNESDTPLSDAKEEEQVDEEIKKETQEEVVDKENQRKIV